MIARTLLVCCCAVTLAGCGSSGLYRWVPFVPKGDQTKHAVTRASRNGPFGPVSGVLVYGLEMRVQIVPEVIKISDTRSFDARIILINRTKKTINLTFNDSRHYDFVLTDGTGKKLVQWSDDQPVVAEPGYTIINPGERAEFTGTLSTRDLAAGRNYLLDSYVVGYDRMRQTISLQPIP